jgi:hypothetical protein
MGRLRPRLSIAVLACALGLTGAVAPARAAEPEVPALAAGADGKLDGLATRARRPERVTPVRLPPDGSFVEYWGQTFRMVGGAAVYLSDWKAVGGRQPTVALTDEQWQALAEYPRDGTFVTASDGRSYRFVAGTPFHISDWAGFGERPATIRVDAATLAHADDHMSSDWYRLGVNGSTAAAERTFDHIGDGGIRINLEHEYFVRGAATGRIYKLVGGAPVYVPSWEPFGGPQPAVTVDQAAIDRAGQPGPWRFVHRLPEDGWNVRVAQTGQVFTIAGGAPLYVATPNTLTMGRPGQVYLRVRPTRVDRSLIERIGDPAPYGALKAYPADGTVLYGVRNWADTSNDRFAEFYRVHDGVAVPTAEGDLPQQDYAPVGVDQITLDRAGEPGVWSHLRAPH